MLTDAQVERYSRQIVLPEVGGRGQARLLAARVVVAGHGQAAGIAAALLARAGIGTVYPAEDPVDPEGADALVDLTDAPSSAVASRRAAQPLVIGRQHPSGRAVLALLVGRPCAACVPPALLVPGEGADDFPALDGPAALALGALAAAETLRALLVPVGGGRHHVLDLASGRLACTPLDPVAGCAACGGSA